MNRQNILYLIFISTILFSCGQKNEATRKIGAPVTKLYYLDSNKVDASDSSYYNGHFKLKADRSEYFNFTSLTDTIEIFYDEKFLVLGEIIVLTATNKNEHHKRIDRNGNVTAELFYRNGLMCQQKSFYQNGNIRWVENHNNKGQRQNDTSFFENNIPNEVALFNNDLVYKNILFYRNGKIESEIYRSVSDNPVFTINYDSITRTPSFYYNKNTTWEDKNNPGVYIGETDLIPVDSSIIQRKKK